MGSLPKHEFRLTFRPVVLEILPALLWRPVFTGVVQVDLSMTDANVRWEKGSTDETDVFLTPSSSAIGWPAGI